MPRIISVHLSQTFSSWTEKFWPKWFEISWYRRKNFVLEIWDHSFFQSRPCLPYIPWRFPIPLLCSHTHPVLPSMSVFLSICLYVRPPICSIYVYLCVLSSLYLFVCPSVFVCGSMCISNCVHTSVCVCLCFRLSTPLFGFVYPSVRLSNHLLVVHLSAHLFIHLSVCPSIC